jgi:hypothetical protein
LRYAGALQLSQVPPATCSSLHNPCQTTSTTLAAASAPSLAAAEAAAGGSKKAAKRAAAAAALPVGLAAVVAGDAAEALLGGAAAAGGGKRAAKPDGWHYTPMPVGKGAAGRDQDGGKKAFKEVGVIWGWRGAQGGEDEQLWQWQRVQGCLRGQKTWKQRQGRGTRRVAPAGKR